MCSASGSALFRRPGPAMPFSACLSGGVVSTLSLCESAVWNQRELPRQARGSVSFSMENTVFRYICTRSFGPHCSQFPFPEQIWRPLSRVSLAALSQPPYFHVVGGEPEITPPQTQRPGGPGRAVTFSTSVSSHGHISRAAGLALSHLMNMHPRKSRNALESGKNDRILSALKYLE